jgi:putative SOS response-associated peptidase YedK
MLRWGLVPFWADDPLMGNRLINARSEEVAAKPVFRAAFRKRRCLVPASGFFEWQRAPTGRRKQPWYYTVTGHDLFAFAGLWELWDKGGRLESFTILTCRPNELVAQVHDRMPVIVKPECFDLWLDPSVEDNERLAPVLKPFPTPSMSARRVSTRVNTPANDDPSLIEPDDPESPVADPYPRAGGADSSSDTLWP